MFWPHLSHPALEGTYHLELFQQRQLLSLELMLIRAKKDVHA